jgi:hypothetical protein
VRENGDPLKNKHSLSDEICEYVHSRSKEKKQHLKNEQLKLIEADRSETLTKEQKQKIQLNCKTIKLNQRKAAFFGGWGG